MPFIGICPVDQIAVVGGRVNSELASVMSRTVLAWKEWRLASLLCLCFCCPMVFDPCLLLCPLHDILFISVDELNETIAANLSDTEFYGGELQWL